MDKKSINSEDQFEEFQEIVEDIGHWSGTVENEIEEEFTKFCDDHEFLYNKCRTQVDLYVVAREEFTLDLIIKDLEYYNNI